MTHVRVTTASPKMISLKRNSIYEKIVILIVKQTLHKCLVIFCLFRESGLGKIYERKETQRMHAKIKIKKKNKRNVNANANDSKYAIDFENFEQRTRSDVNSDVLICN